MPATRSGVSRSRSTIAALVPASSARATSTPFASSTDVSALASASAMACSAASLRARFAVARVWAASRAARACSCTVMGSG